jgi:hypothetical protein
VPIAGRQRPRRATTDRFRSGNMSSTLSVPRRGRYRTVIIYEESYPDFFRSGQFVCSDHSPSARMFRYATSLMRAVVDPSNEPTSLNMMLPNVPDSSGTLSTMKLLLPSWEAWNSTGPSNSNGPR